VLAAAGKMAVAGAWTAGAASAPAAASPLVAIVALTVALLACGDAGFELTARSPLGPTAPAAPAPPPRWAQGMPTDPAYFPIGVWLQLPADAAAYRRVGVNLYVNLWKGPSDDDLSALAGAGMRVICEQNAVGLRHRGDPTIVGWFLHGDPDIELSEGARITRSTVDPETILRAYRDTGARDPARPLFLLLGRGVAWDDDPQRGPRAHHPEDYDTYVRGGDLLGFQLYPMNDYDEPIHGDLSYLGRGVDRLRAWAANAKPVWAWIETTRIHPYSAGQPTPAQVRCEVWLALIHGAEGIVYFCHSFVPTPEDDRALLDDPAMLAAVGAIDAQIASLAPVLHQPPIADGPVVRSGDAALPIDSVAKRWGGATYVFAAALRAGATTADFSVPPGSVVEVLGEGRTLAADGGRCSDRFDGFGVHLYRIMETARGR
jgi:hypothetical protein